ncbi:MAG: two-component regulator propeller domain-containing protein [Chitinophagales bacterium]
MQKSICFILMLVAILHLSAQNVPIEQWNVHVPYNSAVSIAAGEHTIWGTCEASLIAVDKDDFSINRYTKANGLSDVEPAAIAFDDLTGAIIVAYQNANIDIIEGNSITNLPSVKNATIVGNKTINKIHTHNGTAWLACAFGIVKVNIERKEISDTYFVGVGNSNLVINDIWANDEEVYAATEDGVIRGKISPTINLSNADDTTAWKRYTFENNALPEASATTISALNNRVLVTIEDEIFGLNFGNQVWTRDTIFTNWATRGMTSKDNVLYLTQEQVINNTVADARIGTYDGNDFSFLEDNGRIARPREIDIDSDGKIWYADFFQGLALFENGSVSAFAPNAPYKRSALKMTYYDGSVYVASSNLKPTLPSGDDDNLPYGIYISTQQNWNNLNEFNTSVLQGSFDIAVVEPIHGTNSLLVGTDGFGIIELDRNTGNGIVMSSPPGGNSNYRCIAAGSDTKGNVWFTNAYSNAMPLGCRKAGGEYLYFNQKTGALFGQVLNDIVVDEFDQIWLSSSSGGVYVYDYNNTLDDQSDDVLKSIGVNFGLPSGDVRCLEMDRDGEIWIGTSQGIGVVFCSGAIFDNTCGVERICIPREDTTNFCDNLLENEIVNCIAIDPANRKWIGTNGGVFLQSADGLETIYNFKESNSPLLSNVIRSIAVDERTGDVYINTAKGINTFRSTATLTEDGISGAPFVFPNPVRPEYNGPIAIRNLANNGNVKIMDIAGHVVYETQATGGQAIWDGLDVDGKRVQTGVYIVLSADDDGKMKKTAKFVFIN